jgi:DNA-binding transcriptional ArsR family regulator
MSLALYGLSRSRGYLRSLDKLGPVAIVNLQVEYMSPVLDLDRAFAALSDPTRREIVQRLAKGAARVSDLAQPFDMSFNAVSKHVKVLERAGLVRRRRAGREHHIALDPEPIRRIAGWASRYERFWSNRLDKLEAFLKTNRRRD